MKHKLLLFFTFITTFLQAQGFNQYNRLWSTYAGPNGLISPYMVKDNSGNIIIAGPISNSSIYQHRNYFQGFIYPSDNPMMYQTNDYRVSYIAKFTPDGNIIKAGYLPYNIRDIIIDNNNDIIISGASIRTDLGTSNVWFSESISRDLNGNSNPLISKLDSNYNTLWTSYIPTQSTFNHITTDDNGNIYCAGITFIKNGITTEGTFYPTFTLNNYELSSGNALLFKLNTNGQLVWSTYYGEGEIADIQYHNQKLYLVWNFFNSSLDSYNFPSITSDAYQNTPTRSILARFNAINGQRELATFYGESDKIVLNDLYIHDNAIYITGHTQRLSDSTPFITPNSYQSTFGGGFVDYYLAKLDFNFIPIWGTYIGGNSSEFVDIEQRDLKFIDNHIYFKGYTASTDLIFDENTFRSINSGNNDILMMKFSSNGQLVWGSFFGSGSDEILPSLLPINDETFYLAGITDSPKDITTPNTHQPNYSYSPGNRDYGQLFLAKFGRNDDLSTSDISTYTLKIYPNPTKDKVYIQGFIHQDSLIEVYNLVGQKVITQKAKSGLTQTIEVQFLPKGTYIIKAIDINGKVFQEKLLIN